MDRISPSEGGDAGSIPAERILSEAKILSREQTALLALESKGFSIRAWRGGKSPAAVAEIPARLDSRAKRAERILNIVLWGRAPE